MELQRFYPEFKARGAMIVVVSTDSEAGAEAMRAEYNLPFLVLYDADASAAWAWGVFDLLGDGVAAPATFIVNTDGDIAFAHIGRDAGDRPTAADTLLALIAIQSP